jgi:hypothetical protein
MTDNEKIAQWANLGNWLDYCGKDQDAVLLLPILVERGYGVTLNGTLAADYVSFDCHIRHKPKQVISAVGLTVAEAISAAVLDLIAYEP